MKKLLTLATFALATYAHASDLPNAPKPKPVFSKVDWTISADLLATHVGDYLSTEQCIHGTRCHEGILPEGLVHNKSAFAAYEFATAGLEVFGAYELTKHGHRRMAEAAQLVNIGFTVRTVTDNYELSWRTPTIKRLTK